MTSVAIDGSTGHHLPLLPSGLYRAPRAARANPSHSTHPLSPAPPSFGAVGEGGRPIFFFAPEATVAGVCASSWEATPAPFPPPLAAVRRRCSSPTDAEVAAPPHHRPQASPRAPAVAVVVVDRVGDPAIPQLPSPSPGRGAPPRVRPHRRPASRCPPWPSPALPCSLPCVSRRKTTRGSISPFLSFFFSSESFSGPAGQRQPSSPPVAQRSAAARWHAGGPAAARAVFFSRISFSFSCWQIFERQYLLNRKSVFGDSNF